MRKWMGAAAGVVLVFAWISQTQASGGAQSHDQAMRNVSTYVATGRGQTAAAAHAAEAQAAFLETSFRATHAQLQGFEVHMWSPVSDSPVTMSTLTTEIDQLQAELRLSEVHKQAASAGGERLMRLTGSWPDGTQVTVTLSSFDAPMPGPRTLLVVHAENHQGSLNGFGEDLARVHELAAHYSADAGAPEISACLKGFLNDRIVGVHADRLIAAAFQAVSATPVEGVETATLISQSGYSARQSTYIVTNGHKMNLQAAVHPDSYHHCTNVLVGTPIITSTY
jgi:hypothetical protein